MPEGGTGLRSVFQGSRNVKGEEALGPFSKPKFIDLFPKNVINIIDKA